MPSAAELLPSSSFAETRCLRLARGLSLAATAIGLCVLAGWTFHVLMLETVFPGLVSMKPNTAISVCLGGVSLFLAARLRPDPRWSRVSIGLAAGMALLGALTLMEYAVGRDFAIDEWLFKDPVPSAAPGRMAPITAINAVFVGIALILVRVPRCIVAALALAVGAASMSVLAVAGSFYRVNSLYEAGRFTAVAVHTSVAFLLLCAGVGCAGSQSGFMRVIARAGPSGALVRRCLPAAILLPFLVGWFSVQAVSHGWYSAEVGVVVVAMSNAIAFVTLLWIGAWSVHAAESRQAHAQQGLRESEQRLNVVVENLTEGLIIWNLEGTLLHWNRAALSMHGFATQEEGLRLLPRFTEVFEMFSLDGRALPPDQWPLPRLLAGEPLDRTEIRVRRQDQGWERIYRYGGATVQGPDGRRLAFLTIFDVTQQKEADSRLQEVANAMPQIVWTARPDGVLDYANRRWYEYIDQTEEEVSPAEWHVRVHPDDVAGAAEVWAASIASGQPYATEFRVRRADGAYRWFLVRALPIKDPAGGVVRWYGTCTDIHDQRALLEQNAQLLASERAARAEAERIGRLKDEFLATLSHELRTPLNAILGWAQVLRGDPADKGEVTQGLAVIERNARAQNAIIEDLLDMSRIISGKVRLDVQRIDLAPVVEAAIETVRPAAEAKGVRLLPTLDPAAGPVSGDPGRLQQVFWNLLANAIKFTPKGGRVQVLLERVNSHLEIAVSDSGEGIAPEFLPYVFDRFRQQNASSTRQHGGLGLGLAIVKELVELHGGSVRVKSPGRGEGTTFRVALPLTVLQPETVPAEAARRHPQGDSDLSALPLEGIKLAGVKVVVVDDEADARALIQRLLEDRGAIVRTAESAREALELVRAEQPDVLVSDIGMPDEDGYTLMGHVRGLPPERGGSVPALALTAYARPEDRLKAILAGFQMHLAKPVEAVELLVLVATLAGRTGNP